MSADQTLFEIIVFLVAIAVVVPLARRLRIAPVLGYLAAGLILGPYGFGLVRTEEVVHWLAELGVVFLLFAIGLELSLTRLGAIRPSVLVLAALQIVVTAGAIGGALAAFGADWRVAAVLGAGLSLSSTALAATLLAERGEIFLRYGRIAIAVLLIQDLAVVPFLIAVPLLAGSGGLPDDMIWAAGRAVGAVLAIVVLGRLILPPLLRILAAGRNTEVMVAATIAIVLGVGWISHWAGLSMMLGAFLAGVLLAETDYRHSIEADVQPLRGILLALFFLTVGMSVDPAPAIDEPLLAAGLVLALVALKTLVIGVLGVATGQGAGLSLRLGLMLSQAGEFGFVLFGLALVSGVLDGQTVSMAAIVIAGSMALTPFLAQLSGRIAARLDRNGGADVAELESECKDLEGHVIVAGFGRVGRTVAHLLLERKIPVIALDIDAVDVHKARSDGLPVYYGDAVRPDVLRAVGAERAKAIVITLDQPHVLERLIAMLRWRFPDLPVYARARDRSHAKRLLSQGAEASVPETFEASLRLGLTVLTALGVSEVDATRAINEFRAGEMGPAPE